MLLITKPKQFDKKNINNIKDIVTASVSISLKHTQAQISTPFNPGLLGLFDWDIITTSALRIASIPRESVKTYRANVPVSPLLEINLKN